MINNKIYVNKYDFVGYYTKQPALWFLPNAIVDSIIQTEIHKYKKFGSDIDELEDDDEKNEEIEIDCYEFYKQQLFENKDIDKNNPKIQEGIIIDKKSREFIINEYKDINNVIDLEEKYYDQRFDNEFLAIKTEELISKYDNLILFQSVFIFNEMITKPDAIIKYNGQIVLIETKGTTTSKMHHALDIYFQSQVLSQLSYLADFELYYKLCLVAYKKANKYEVPFILTDYFNYTKTVSIPTTVKEMIEVQKIEYKQMIKRGDGLIWNNKEVENTAPVSFDCICNNSLEDFVQKLEVVRNGASRKSIEKAIMLFSKIINQFNDVIKELYKLKLDYNENVKPKIKQEAYIISRLRPDYNDKGDFKNSDLWQNLRKLYQLEGYELFNYSGNVVDQTNQRLVNLPKQIELTDYIKKPALLDLFSQLYHVNLTKTKNLLDRLKDKKVYFDFETINTAIRPLNHCLPFMQIVTQCSIIIDDNSCDIKQVKCNNLLYDPIKLSINDFKEIVDCLYRGDDYSYVVYNKNFESSRLKEFIDFINEPEYTNKINVIRNNLYDLADFFNICSKDGHAIYIQELGGYYSIKKVLPLIEKYKPDIFTDTGCKDYTTLDIGNGLVAQNETTLRFLSKEYDDSRWLVTDRNLKIYCENDVRAMVAVEYFVKWIFNQASTK